MEYWFLVFSFLPFLPIMSTPSEFPSILAVTVTESRVSSLLRYKDTLKYNQCMWPGYRGALHTNTISTECHGMNWLTVWCLGRRTSSQEWWDSVVKQSLSSLKSCSLGILSTGTCFAWDEFVPQCFREYKFEWIHRRETSLEWRVRSSLLTNFPGIQSEVLLGSSLIHHWLFYFTSPPHAHWRSCSFLAWSLPCCFCIGEKKADFSVAVCLFPVEMITPVLLQVAIFLIFHSAGRCSVFCHLSGICLLLMAAVSCGNKSSRLAANWVERAEK